MDNEQLFNILEKLLDELEYYAEEADGYHRHDIIDYCKNVRHQVFTEDCNLSFNVVTK